MGERDRKHILIVESERDVCELLSRALESSSKCYRCYHASTEADVFDLMREIHFDIVFVDLQTAARGDFRLIKKIKQLSPKTLIILNAFIHQKQHVTAAIAHGAYGYITKPIKVDALRERMKELHAVLED